MVDYLYKFTWKKNGYVTYSRHKRPDFVYGMTDEEIDEQFIVEKVTDEEEIRKNTW